MTAVKPPRRLFLSLFGGLLIISSLLTTICVLGIVLARGVAYLLPASELSFAPVLPQDADIYALDLERNLRFNLTRDESREWAPAWSPDGNRLAFLSNRDGMDGLYVMDADGRNQRAIALPIDRQPTSLRSPAWLPDSARLAVQLVGGNAAVTVIVNVDPPHTARMVPNPPNGAYNQMTFSPSTEQGVFASAHDGDSDIYLRDESGEVRPLLRRRGWDEYPTWSPDGLGVIFQSYIVDNWEIVRVDLAAENNAPQLVNLTQYARVDVQPAWSPDGSQVAFVSVRSVYRQIFVMDSDGHNVRPVTFDNLDYGFPAWRP